MNDSKTDVTGTTSIFTTSSIPVPKNELSVIPNLTKGLTIIDLKLETEQNVKLELYSSTGQMLRNINLGKIQTVRQSVDLSDLPSGIYLVRAIGQQTSIIKKVILQQ